MRTIIRTIPSFYLFLFILLSCRKTPETSGKDQAVMVAPASGLTMRGGEAVYSLSNENLLKLLLSGVGGYIQLDSNCAEYSADISCRVEFPVFTPPAIVNGILCFASDDDYNSFIRTADLAEDLWKYTDNDYEDTPLEVFHLGDESLNAYDSAIAFMSLRSIYELNEYYNNNWRDTAAISIEDEEMISVLNEQNEVKIGRKYYKYIANNILAIINDNPGALDSVRTFGILTPGNNCIFLDERADTIITPHWDDLTDGTNGCGDFDLFLYAGFSSSVNSSSSKWSLNATILNPVTGSHPNLYKNVKGNFTVNWGDGTIESYVTSFGSVNSFSHIYQYPATGFISRNITVTCKLIQQTSPSQGYNNLIQNCPNLPGILFSSGTGIKLETYNYPDCLSGKIVREFTGVERVIDGTRYRADCKLSQVTNSNSFIVTYRHAKVTATIVFEKLKNGRWKKTKSLGDLTVNLRGNVYRIYDCTDIFYSIDQNKTRKKRKKVKLKLWGIPGTGLYFPNDFRSHRKLPLAINADFKWGNSNGQVITGNYQEVLKP